MLFSTFDGVDAVHTHTLNLIKSGLDSIRLLFEGFIFFIIVFVANEEKWRQAE